MVAALCLCSNVLTSRAQPLKVQPNPPRFLREGDKIDLAVKVVNLSDSERTGQMSLELTDPTTGETADGLFTNIQPNQYFTVPAHGNWVVAFPLTVPYQYNRPVTYRIVAQAGNYNDGEQATLPVVSNRMLVTETLPISIPADGTWRFKFDKLLQSGGSETLNSHLLTIEFTSNPAWYAVQALPYLMEYPYECAEQTFDRLYANALAGKILGASPGIARVFERWRTVDTSAWLSSLQRDPGLKSVLLEETPWVLEGKTEGQQKKNISLLLDVIRTSRELDSAIGKLADMQAEDGGFPWFVGGPDDRYITQYILTGIGRLRRLQALPVTTDAKIKKIMAGALPYLDRMIEADYAVALKVPGGMHEIDAADAQYLYMRSYFTNGIPGDAFPAVNFYRKLAQRSWTKAGRQVQGMLALALFRTGDVQTARNIVMSLRQTAIHDTDRGMYWKEMTGGFHWWQAPVETESLLIETFREVSGDAVADREMKTWLLRQKQTHHWPTTRSTADAVYALLIGGQNWLSRERRVTMKLGEKTVDLTAGEAGAGYNKKIFDAPFINPGMGNITVTMKTADMAAGKPGASPASGAVYWQYFDQLDQIGSAHAGNNHAPLRISKRLFVQRRTPGGPVLDTVPENGTLHVGDRVVIRIVMRADRDLGYIHLQDKRAACLEPISVRSGYRWQDGLGYYESTKDAGTDFFFPTVPRGTYAFEYPLIVEQSGEFSNGLAGVECMYAPEFADHTEGIRFNVEDAQR